MSGWSMPDTAMAAVEMLRVTDLHAFYGESHVLHGIDFTVNKGEVVTLLGRNGAGRTTTLRAILGLTGKRSGSIMINGRETIALPTHHIAHLGIGYCPEERGIFASLTTEENLLLPPEAGADLGLALSPIQRMAFLGAAALVVLVFSARLISAESKARQMGLFLYIFVAVLILALFAVVAGQGGGAIPDGGTR